MAKARLLGRVQTLEDRRKEETGEAVRVIITRSLVEKGEDGPLVFRTVRRTVTLRRADSPKRKKAKR